MFLQFTYKHGTIGPELLHDDFFLFGELSHKQTQIDFDANQNIFDMPHKSFVLIIVISPKQYKRGLPPIVSFFAGVEHEPDAGYDEGDTQELTHVQ